MSSVSDIIKEKGTEVFTIRDTATVFEAVVAMESKGVGCLVVMHDDGICGIATGGRFAHAPSSELRGAAPCPV